MQHFLLTRFNLLLWRRDKEGAPVRSLQWLTHRFSLFEQYCLPSVQKQSCQVFAWIILFDAQTPDSFKDKIAELKSACSQLIPVYVDPKRGREFATIFREEVTKRLNGERVITTYLDNDDALDVRFVEDLQRRVSALKDGTFISYDDGYQLFTDHDYVMRIHYPRNHFVSVVERGDALTLKTIYGYGSHYYIDKIPGVKIERVKGQPMWCEVIHDRNMGNDAYFLRAKMVRDKNLLATSFGIEEKVHYGIGLYLYRFLPRYVRTFIRRVGYFFFGRHW